MLDKNSYRIMYELFLDGRSTNSAIAEKLGISVITVAKKINAMIEDEVISIKAIPNPVKMGNHASALIGIEVDIRKISSICAELEKVPNINMMVTTFGRFDLLFIVYFQNWRLLENFVKIELHQIDGINSVCTIPISQSVKGHNVVFDNAFTGTDKPDIDVMDMKLIVELMKNGRPLYSDLAQKLGTSASTISRRISSLINSGIIKIVATPNTSLEYLANAFILMRVDFSKVDEICERLVSLSQSHLVMKLTSDYDILLTVHSKNRADLFRFIVDEVSNIDGVLRSETFILADFLFFNVDALLHNPIDPHSKTA